MPRELKNALGDPEPWEWYDPRIGEVATVTRQTFFAARAEARRILGTDEIRLLKGPFS